MAEDKQLRRDVSAIWDAVRQVRRARRKMTSKDDLVQSAALLHAHADALSVIADQSVAPASNEAVAAGPKEKAEAKKAKPKRKRKRASAKKAESSPTET